MTSQPLLRALMFVALTATAASADPGDDAYQRGRQHYDLQEWDQAIAEFKEAYRLRSDAASLFNIAQSYRLKGECAEAASFYKTYRRNFPNEKNIARVDQFITEMEACANQASSGTGAAGTKTGDGASTSGTGTTGSGTGTTGTTGNAGNSATTPGGSSTQTGPAAPSPQPAETPRSGMPRGYVIGAIAAGGAGIGSILVGAWAGSRARSIESDVEHLAVWDPEVHERGQRMDLAAKLLFVGGGAAIVTSGVLLYLGLRHSDEPAPSTALQIVPRTDGASLVWSGSL